MEKLNALHESIMKEKQRYVEAMTGKDLLDFMFRMRSRSPYSGCVDEKEKRKKKEEIEDTITKALHDGEFKNWLLDNQISPSYFFSKP